MLEHQRVCMTNFLFAFWFARFVVVGCVALYGAFLLRASQKHQSLLAQQSFTEEGENDFFSRPLRRAGGGFAAVTHASADALHKASFDSATCLP